MALRLYVGNIECIATGSNCCINAQQSWKFNPTSFSSFIDTRLWIFDEQLLGTLIPARHWYNSIFSFLDQVWYASGKYVFYPLFSGDNCSRTRISTKSNLDLTVALVLPGILSNMPITLPHTFFSIYMIFRQCLTNKNFQYRRSKKIDLFHTFFSIVFWFSFS